MKKVAVVTARREEGVDTDELQKRLQSTFNRYKATVSVKDTRKGINIRIKTIPKGKLDLLQLREMRLKVDRIVDGDYADIFELRAGWVEANKDLSVDLVLDYVFEGESASVKETAAIYLDGGDIRPRFERDDTSPKAKKILGEIIKIMDKVPAIHNKLYDLEEKFDKHKKALKHEGYHLVFNFNDLGA